jgi:hypothetical protein
MMGRPKEPGVLTESVGRGGWVMQVAGSFCAFLWPGEGRGITSTRQTWLATFSSSKLYKDGQRLEGAEGRLQ